MVTPKAQVLEGRGTQGHLEIWSLGNHIPRGFQDVFSTMDALVVSLEYTQDWEQCRRNVSGVPRHHKIQTFHRSKPV